MIKRQLDPFFSLHGGNRGFGHTVDTLILVCGYLSCYGANERDCVFVDCGIFTLNLTYALHYNEVGTCILNWSVPTENDRKLRTIVRIRDEEMVCSLIACGNIPSEIKLCDSGKKDLSDIVHFV